MTEVTWSAGTTFLFLWVSGWIAVILIAIWSVVWDIRKLLEGDKTGVAASPEANAK